ncbi:SDR family NAD(P)-dependent oxidoreductase [Actinoplanes couchii]|uniref:Retinol dehydrogenase n=1 Tax=Actinoplanes couchii TaxID=403638 RepID=A0ABQ3XTJ7_9ACTN|nr:SDR family NAD(P)-dependent oxidoreductase [Actinoplanes couchii]MDR6318707.1 NAD(P)-dependent dehydrogenase (short-subunit alcohol dehydrogenase family) [Actinoplanes couchii]GID61788.1 retinol dehydrogenase [Actinoplanes couchii]
MSVRTALITGASGSLGHQICRQLHRHAETVIVHASTPASARAARVRLIRTGWEPGRIHAVSADFRRLSEVARLAADIRRHHPTLDLLVNGAGAITAPGFTPDGIDTTFQVNYVAPYALTRLLAPALNAVSGRVVTLTSAAHRDARLNPDRPGTDLRRPAEAFKQAHLALVMFSRTLARCSQRRITAVAVHPGVIHTGSFATVHGAGGLPAADGSAHVMHAVGLSGAHAHGSYFEGLLPGPLSAQAADDNAGLRLWQATAALIGWDYTGCRLPGWRPTDRADAPAAAGMAEGAARRPGPHGRP